MVLTTQPMVNVVLKRVQCANTLEATVNTATLTFTPDNWNVAQTITVTGVSDLVADGTQFTTITVSVNAATSDHGYDAAVNKTVSVSTTDVVPLQTPILNPVAANLGARPPLSWQAVPNATRYEVWFSRVYPSAARIYLDSNVTTTSWTPPADLPSGLYRYRARAFDAGDSPSSWSAANTFNVRPTLVSPLGGSFTNPTTFQWTAIPFATSYDLFLRTSNGDQYHQREHGQQLFASLSVARRSNSVVDSSTRIPPAAKAGVCSVSPTHLRKPSSLGLFRGYDNSGIDVACRCWSWKVYPPR